MKILLVCTGNTCRSSMAQALLQHELDKIGIEDIEVTSAGIAAFDGQRASSHALRVLGDQDIDLTGHRSKLITTSLIEQSDLILTMTTSHKGVIVHNWPRAKDKTFTLKEFAKGDEENLDIQDPFGGNLEQYRQCAQEIKEYIDLALKKIKK
jgi:protein-tyrosine-phosphatase